MTLLQSNGETRGRVCTRRLKEDKGPDRGATWVLHGVSLGRGPISVTDWPQVQRDSTRCPCSSVHVIQE